VVDDDPVVLKLFDRTLRGAGYQTSCYLEPEGALSVIDSLGPSVIISDYMMPGKMDGIAFLQRARTCAPRAMRILCTAAADFHVAQQAVNSGEVYRILSKPWHVPDLLATVHQAAEAWRLRYENEYLTAEVQRQNDQLRENTSRLEEMVRERTDGLFDGLIAALDFRDTETQWHSRRVSLYARRLGQQVGLSEHDLTIVERGALLHDIGKIGVPDGILRKPGPLSPEEWVEMRRHPELGWALLNHVEYLRSASLVVLQHHEKWDGTGYPSGLGGNDIVIGARIFHVVDTLDAITTDRPYRRARGFDVASAEIARCSGTQFDPRVVEAFQGVLSQDWERIRQGVERLAVRSTSGSDHKSVIRRSLEENAAAVSVSLTSEDLSRIEEVAPKGVFAGERYRAEGTKRVNLNN
jgi:response regulator RpfG family c-di-GMP phosphodiesterase